MFIGCSKGQYKDFKYVVIPYMHKRWKFKRAQDMIMVKTKMSLR